VNEDKENSVGKGNDSRGEADVQEVKSKEVEVVKEVKDAEVKCDAKRKNDVVAEVLSPTKSCVKRAKRGGNAED